MKEYKILLTGKNTAIINDFFMQMDQVFECETTSVRYDDMKSHIKHFYPDLFVYCMKNETKEDMTAVVNLHKDMKDKGIGLAIVCDMGEYKAFLKTPNCALDLFLQRPINTSQIQSTIIHYLNNKSNAKQDILNAKKPSAKAGINNPETQNLMEQIDAEISMMEIAHAEKTSDPFFTDPNYDGKKRILVVDDDVSMVKAIKGHLQDEYDVSTALSGSLAKRFLKNRHVDLILLDYEMPFENGSSVMKSIRATKETKNIPIVFLTGVNDAEKIQEVLSLKPQGYLLKPVDHDTLLQKVHEIIG